MPIAKLDDRFRVSEEVRTAQAEHRPVVALESTLVAHGLPWPDSYEVGRALEATVREHGAVPATIAVVSGRIAIGITGEEMEAMAHAQSLGDKSWPKTGAADLAPRLARGANGATTVSATAYAAARAGIRLFATGGIGGVHRGDASDVSSDLTTIAQTSIAVVSAGMKAILDLPRTLEVLETMGVTVLGLGTAELPAFYARESGLAIPAVADASAAAAVLSRQATLGWPSGIVFANPPPQELAMPAAVVERLVEDALAAGRAAGISGKDETPFLLAHMARASEGRTVALNEALVLSNATLAGRIAVAAARARP